MVMTGPFLKVLGTNKAKYLTQSTLLTQKLHCFEKMFFHRMQKLFCWIFRCILHCTGVLFLSCTDLGTKGEIWLQAIGWGDPASTLPCCGEARATASHSHLTFMQQAFRQKISTGILKRPWRLSTTVQPGATWALLMPQTT